MFRILLTSAAVTMALGGGVIAKTFKVKMLNKNKGEGGAMIFEPAVVRIAAGGTVKFFATDRGHSFETAKGNQSTIRAKPERSLKAIQRTIKQHLYIKNTELSLVCCDGKERLI